MRAGARAGSLVSYYSELEPPVLGLVCHYSEFELTILGTRITRMWAHALQLHVCLMASTNQETWNEDGYWVGFARIRGISVS
jgi:hypothetical protein